MLKDPTKTPKPRAALSLRGIGLEYGIARGFVSELVRMGKLPAIRRGRALLVLRSDFEKWWREEAASQLGSSGNDHLNDVLDRMGDPSGEDDVE